MIKILENNLIWHAFISSSRKPFSTKIFAKSNLYSKLALACTQSPSVPWSRECFSGMCCTNPLFTGIFYWNELDKSINVQHKYICEAPDVTLHSEICCRIFSRLHQSILKEVLHYSLCPDDEIVGSCQFSWRPSLIWDSVYDFII